MKHHRKFELTIVFILAVLAGMALSSSSIFGQCANGRCCYGGQCSTGNNSGRWVYTYYGWQWQRVAKPAEEVVTTEDDPKLEEEEPAIPAKLQETPKTFRERALDRINFYRSQRGLPALSLDLQMCNSCDNHSRWMAFYGFQHSGSGMECIATGTATPEATVDMWMGSPSHCAILMSGRVLGIGWSGIMWTARIR